LSHSSHDSVDTRFGVPRLLCGGRDIASGRRRDTGQRQHGYYSGTRGRHGAALAAWTRDTFLRSEMDGLLVSNFNPADFIFRFLIARERIRSGDLSVSTSATVLFRSYTSSTCISGVNSCSGVFLEVYATFLSSSDVSHVMRSSS